MKQFNDIYKKTTNANCICDNEIEKMKNIEQIVVNWQNTKCVIVYYGNIEECIPFHYLHTAN